MTTEPTVTTDQAAAASAVPSLRSPHITLSPRRPWLLGALLLAAPPS